jgi:putative ABC transport system substrate-binding protein
LKSVAVLWLLLVCLFPGSMRAAEFGRPVRIGALTPSWGPPPGVVGLIDGLTDIGYLENEDFVVGVRFTRGDISALPKAAEDLVHSGVDIIYAIGEKPLEAAQRFSGSHPIVFTSIGNPVERGFVDSFSHPGGNITGITDQDPILDGKRLQLFKELIPDLQRVLFPYDENDDYQLIKLAQFRKAAKRLGITLIDYKLSSMEQARQVLSQLKRAEIDGILDPLDTSLNIPGFVLEATTRQGIPSLFRSSFYVEIGGLASYGSSFYASGRQVARLVDKIIKGIPPGEIPVEVDQYFEFVINLKVAEKLGITIAPELLFQADRVIR